MASRHPVMLVLSHDDWCLARCSAQGVEQTESRRWEQGALEREAEGIVAALANWNAAGGPLLIGLSGTLCVSQLLKLPTPRHARQRQALGYLFEPYLPWAAEETVADYEIRGLEAFAVGTSAEALSPLLRALEERQIRISSITPLGRLALRFSLKHSPSRALRRGILWGAGDTADFWIVEGQRPLLWRHFPLTDGNTLRELKETALREISPLPLQLIGVPEDLRGKLAELPGIALLPEISETITTPLEAALQTAQEIAHGRADAPLEFRRDQFAPVSRNRSLTVAQGALQLALCCLLLATGLTLYRWGAEYDRLRLEAGDRQREIFRRLFPDLPAPVGVKNRLDSEYAKLRGLRGEDLQVAESIPAIRLMEQLLQALPADLRYRILEVRIDHGKLYVVGQVRAHADADRIADELRKVKLIVEAPSTHRLPQQGVEFRISAQFAADVTDSGKEKS